MNLKRLKVLIILYLMISLLVACSYREFEDSLRRQLDGEDENEIINETIVPDRSEDETDSEAGETNDEQSENEADRLYYIGDTALQFGVEYTINDVQISDNIHEVGLDRAGFIDVDRIEDNGEIQAGFKLVTVDVTIKNISAGGYDPDGEHDKPNLFAEDLIGFKSGLEDPIGPFMIEADYFSEHPPYEQNQWTDYIQFQLDYGEEREATFAWTVPTERLNSEPLYYLTGAVHSTDLGSRAYRYFHIVSDGEVVYPD